MSYKKFGWKNKGEAGAQVLNAVAMEEFGEFLESYNLERVDICKNFGVSVNEEDNAGKINEAIEQLGKEGKIAYIGTPGSYHIKSPIIIGNGSGGVKLSEWTGRLEGVGMPGFYGYTFWTGGLNQGVQITWHKEAPVNEPMVKIQGPVTGAGLRKLVLHGNGRAGSPIESIGSLFGVYEYLYTVECYNGITTEPAKVTSGQTTNQMHNRWHFIGIKYNGYPESLKSTKNAAITLKDTPDAAVNNCFEDWNHVYIIVPKTSVGNEHSAIYLVATDTSWFRNIHPSYGSGGTDPQFSVTFDYTGKNKGWPESILIDGINLVKNPRNVGTPNPTGKNMIVGISEANGGVGKTNPELENLFWQVPAVIQSPGAGEVELRASLKTLGLIK